MSRTLIVTAAVWCAVVGNVCAQNNVPTALDSRQPQTLVEDAKRSEMLVPGAVTNPRAGDRGVAQGTSVAEPRPAAEVAWWAQSTWWLVPPAWLLALASLGLAIHTARLAKSTALLVNDGKETSRRELRAYVALDEIFFSEADDAAAGQHTLRIRNYGQTPASGMSIWCERASHLPQEGVKPFYDAPLVAGQLLHPVQAFSVALAAAPLYRIGKPGFFTYGRIIYHDIYGQWWVTKFCYRHEGEGNFVPHGDYNSEEGPFDQAPA